MDITFINLLLTLGGTSGIMIGVLYWLSNRITEKLKVIWEGNKEKELENLKSSLEKERDILNIALSSLSKSSQIEQKKSLSGIEKLWTFLIDLRKYAGSATTFYTVLIPKEYNDAFSNDKIMSMIQHYSLEDIVEKTKGGNKDIEVFRPYFGEILWALFFVYRAFLMRVCWIIARGLEKTNIPNWRNDTGLKQMIESVFTKDEIKHIIGSDIYDLQNIISNFEQKIMIEISKILSGKRRAEINFESANKILQTALKNQIDNRD